MLPNDHALFRSIFRTASVGMVTADPEQRLKHCNLALCAMLGYGHEEIIGLRLADVVAPEDIARIEPELFHSTGEQASHSTWRFRRKDGSTFPGAVLSCKLPDGFMQAIVVSATESNRPEAICFAQENKDRYFSKLEKQLREAGTAREAIRAACEAIGQELGAVLAGMGEFHPDGKHTIVDNAWSATGDLALLLGRHGQFDAGRIAGHLTSGVAAVEDVLTDHRLVGDEGAQAVYKAVGARSSIAVPLTREGRPWAVLFVADKTPRAWTDAEIALAQETLERVWHAVERARAEEELRLMTERFQLALKGSPVTLFCQDLDLRYTWISNPSLADAPSDVIGRLPDEVYERAEDAAATEAIKREAIHSGRSQRQEVAIHSGGVEQIYDLLADPLRDASGKITGVRCAAIDITARKQAEAALRESKERQSFLLALNDALRQLSDPAEIMATASRLLGSRLAAGQVAYADIDEAGKHAVISREWNDGTIPIKAAVYGIENFSALLQDLKRGQTILISDVRTDCVIPSEKLEGLKRASIRALLNVPLVKDDRLVAVLAVHVPTPRAWTPDEVILAQEVAERTWEAVQRARAEQALREREELLRFSLRGAGAGAWQWDIAGNRVLASPESYELFGGAARFGEAITFGDWLQCLHPEDRTQIERAVYDAFEEKSPEFRAEYRVVLPSGEVRWLDGVGKVDYAANGTPVRISGITADISKRKQAEDALRKSEESLRLALKGSGAGAWQWNISTNEMLASLEGYEIHGRADLFGKPTTYEDWAECLHPEDRATAEKVVTDALEKRSPEYTNEYRVVLLSGGVRWVGVLGKVDYAADGTPLRMSGITTDISKRKQAEDALRDSEKRLKFALEAAGAGTWEVALATGELAASDRTLSLLGIPPGSPATFEEMLACVHPEDRPRIEAALHHTLETGEPYRLEWRVPLPDGSVLWRESRAERRSISGKQVVAGLVLDITDRKRAEEALRESQERLQFALEAANAGTWEGVPETGEFTASERALALHGLPPGTLMTQENAVAAVHPDDRPRVTEVLRHTLETGQPYRIELRMPLPDGSTRWVEACGEPRFVSGRRVISGLLQDITERKHAEIALRENEGILRAIIEHVPAPILLSREDRKILRINPALTALTGYTAADIPTRDEWEQFAYREHAQEIRDTLHIAFESSIPLDRPDLCVYTKSGEKRIWSVRTAPAGRDSSGQRLFVSVALDITDRRRSAEEAQITKSKLEAALASMADAVFISDVEGRFIHINEAFAKFHRFKSKEDCVKTFAEYPAFLDLFRPSGELAPLEEWPLRRALRGETGTLAEYVIKRRSGETYIGSYNFAPIRDCSGDITGAVVTARDITDKKRAENRLRESEARLSSIIDTAADSIMVLDEKGRIQSANPATLGILGYSAEDLIGQHISVLMPPHIQADHDSYLAHFSGSSALKEVEARREDGSTIPLDVAVAEWRDGEGRCFYTGILRDLSERKYNEEVLANARRLEAVGQLAGGVAHDFNNLLAVIAGNLELAEDRIADEMTRDLIRRALDAAEKGSGLNRRLLSLARKRMLKPQRLTLNSRVEETAKLLASIVGEHIAVITDLAPDPWVTVADPGEIDSAILNIAANARDAMPNGGRITIATSNATIAAATATKLHRDARPGEYVCLSIADDGVGMPEEILRKAMDPFFTTKGQGAGTGLGLTSVASFAKQTGGFATVESAPGRGCAVSLYLPRSIKNVPPRETGRSEFPRGNGELVLVVEDNDEVREVTLKRIESLGYAVAEARTGPEALQRLQSKGSIHLVLSDIIMPGGMSGYDVARWLASNNPVTKVILCSGYNEGDRLSHTRGSIRDITVLGKPYTREQLAAALKNALAAVHYVHEESSKSAATGSSKKA